MGDRPEAIEGQAKLFRVLTAFARYNPQIGYVQGNKLPVLPQMRSLAIFLNFVPVPLLVLSNILVQNILIFSLKRAVKCHLVGIVMSLCHGHNLVSFRGDNLASSPLTLRP